MIICRPIVGSVRFHPALPMGVVSALTCVRHDKKGSGCRPLMRDIDTSEWHEYGP